MAKEELLEFEGTVSELLLVFLGVGLLLLLCLLRLRLLLFGDCLNPRRLPGVHIPPHERVFPPRGEGIKLHLGHGL